MVACCDAKSFWKLTGKSTEIKYISSKVILQWAQSGLKVGRNAASRANPTANPSSLKYVRIGSFMKESLHLFPRSCKRCPKINPKSTPNWFAVAHFQLLRVFSDGQLARPTDWDWHGIWASHQNAQGKWPESSDPGWCLSYSCKLFLNSGRSVADGWRPLANGQWPACPADDRLRPCQ